MKPVLLYMDLPGDAEYLLILIVIIILVAIFWRKRVNVSTNWLHAFVEYQFSTQDFYTQLGELIAKREMPNVSISRINYATSHLISERREYLRIARKDSIFDICVAPFGTGSFVSYWYGEPRKTLKQLMRRVATTYIKNPDVHQIIDNFNNKTRYQYDTDSVFQVWVKDCINEAIEEVKANKGIRTALTNEQ